MRIGIILNQYPVPSETFIESFLEHLNGHELTVFARLTHKSYQKNNWRFKPYLNRVPKNAQLFQYIKTFLSIFLFFNRFIILKKKGIPLKQLIADAGIWTIPSLDVLHFPFANNAFGREHYAEVLGAKMTLSFRGSDLNVYPVYHQRSYAGVWPYVHKVHCNSQELATKLNEHNIPFSIPVDVITPALRKELNHATPRSPLPGNLGTAQNPLVIMSLGRLHWVKDYPLGLRITAELKKKGVYVQLHILGDGPEREQLMFLRHELGLQTEVHLKGRVSATDIEAYFCKAHVYLQTSLAEGFSNACMEAQAFGLPCVVPPISGMRACVLHGKTGMVVDDRKEASFVNAIKHIIENSGQFDPVEISNRIKSEFSLSIQQNAWLNFFNTLVLNS